MISLIVHCNYSSNSVTRVFTLDNPDYVHTCIVFSRPRVAHVSWRREAVPRSSCGQGARGVDTERQRYILPDGIRGRGCQPDGANIPGWLPSQLYFIHLYSYS